MVDFRENPIYTWMIKLMITGGTPYDMGVHGTSERIRGHGSLEFCTWDPRIWRVCLWSISRRVVKRKANLLTVPGSDAGVGCWTMWETHLPLKELPWWLPFVVYTTHSWWWLMVQMALGLHGRMVNATVGCLRAKISMPLMRATFWKDNFTAVQIPSVWQVRPLCSAILGRIPIHLTGFHRSKLHGDPRNDFWGSRPALETNHRTIGHPLPSHGLSSLLLI